MAQAIICDRCGRVSRADITGARYHIFDAEKETNCYSNMRNMWNGEKLGECLDLCNFCAEKLAKWVSMDGT